MSSTFLCIAETTEYRRFAQSRDPRWPHIENERRMRMEGHVAARERVLERVAGLGKGLLSDPYFAKQGSGRIRSGASPVQARDGAPAKAIARTSSTSRAGSFNPWSTRKRSTASSAVRGAGVIAARKPPRSSMTAQG